MKCRVAEGMVNRYINHTLTIDELEEFLEHISTCSSCYDELETYFCLLYTSFYFISDLPILRG